jgi:hypothetical protein
MVYITEQMRIPMKILSKKGGRGPLAAWLLAGLCSCATPQRWQPVEGHLMTRWAREVSPANALSEYPRPQMRRKHWQNLNGLWEYGLTAAADTAPPTNFDARILVPFPYESALSGVGKASIPSQRLWYRRTFTLPAGAQNQRVLLHCGAVNWDSTVLVNGHAIGAHRGGYEGFDFDITDSLKAGANELMVSAWNPVRSDVAEAQVLGKQRLRPGGIFYTAVSGIWQTVWLETVPVQHIAALKITPDVDHATLRLTVDASTAGQVIATASDGGKTVATATGTAGTEINLAIANPHFWSPAAPHLYDLAVELVEDGKTVDRVDSYFAMRKISLGKDEQGRTRIFLNNKLVLQCGPLDQGYWPDGIYTAPTDQALRFDIDMTKKFGWNTIRKHAKVEPARWYYWADKLGILVWQDMPQMFGGRNNALSGDAKKQFESEWRRIIAQFYNSPSIVVWTTFNEGWGQHDTESVVELTKELDPTRLVNNASGWTDKKVGDLYDTHAYPGPGSRPPEENRAAVNGEFGGVTMEVEGHRWTKSSTYGYGSVLNSSWLATKRYQALLKRAYEMKDELGVSAFIYTQLTDVEQEINGLLTYDRAVVKLDQKIVAAANQGQFPPLPPNPNPEWLPTSGDEPVTWSYTTNQPAGNWFAPDFDARAWQTGPAPFGHRMTGTRTEWTSADIWIRREFQVSGAIPARLDLLVKHHEDAEIYLNGILAGNVTGSVDDYKTVPISTEAQASLKPGRNVIAAHCHNSAGSRGIDVGIAKAGPPQGSPPAK